MKYIYCLSLLLYMPLIASAQEWTILYQKTQDNQVESKGLIEARPPSGYYVKFSPKDIFDISTCGEPTNRQLGNADGTVSIA